MGSELEIERDRLVDAFSDCVGREKARDVIDDIARETGLEDADTYSEEEAVELAARIANQADATPYVRTAANTLQTRIRTGQL